MSNSSLQYCVIGTNVGTYDSVGAGGYYLPTNSACHGAGTTNIDPALLADLQARTTYPPIIVTGTWFTNSETFSPQATRDTNASLDLGYHYDPLDYALNICVSNATVNVQPGTAIGMFGFQYGIWLYYNGIINCTGTATSPNYIVRYNTVQEQSNTNWESTAWDGSVLAPESTDSSSEYYASTVWSVLASDYQMENEYSPSPIGFRDCQFYGGQIFHSGPAIASTNSLYQRVALRVVATSDSVSFYNNLFWEGSLTFRHNTVDTWTFRDNLFDHTAITNLNGGSIDICSNNAYVTTNFGVLPPENNDLILGASPAYEVGPLGENYYPINSQLINAGSQSAIAAGLAFYTVVTNNAIDGAKMVSIGYHYLDVGVGADGQPVADTLPDSWQLEYFGVIGIDTNADFDGTGQNIFYDYNYSIDPNVISFNISFTNQYVNLENMPIQLPITAGIPFYMATLLDDSNFIGATWVPFSSNLTVNLGTVQGWHTVWVGLRGFSTNAQQTWNSIRVKLDLTPPVLVITNPLPGAVTAPYIQVQGYGMEELARIYYNSSNSTGFWTNQPGYVTSRQFNTNIFDYTTNGFQCFNIPLANGTNNITLQATDLAGNLTATNLVYVLNPSANTNPPVITLNFPLNGTYISGTNFTVRGLVSDPFASITAQIVNGGTATTVTGEVEQNDSFWAENLPLGSGTNYLTITATNSAGYGVVTNVTVFQNTVALAVTGVVAGMWGSDSAVYGIVNPAIHPFT